MQSYIDIYIFNRQVYETWSRERCFVWSSAWLSSGRLKRYPATYSIALHCEVLELPSRFSECYKINCGSNYSRRNYAHQPLLGTTSFICRGYKLVLPILAAHSRRTSPLELASERYLNMRSALCNLSSHFVMRNLSTTCTYQDLWRTGLEVLLY